MFHNDSGHAAAEAWLVAAEEAELWISHWVLLEFASATAVRLRRGDLKQKVDAAADASAVVAIA